MTLKRISKFNSERIFFMGREFFKSQLLIIGTDSNAEKIAMRLLNDASVNYNLIGFVEYYHGGANKKLLGCPVLGTLETIPDILKNLSA